MRDSDLNETVEGHNLFERALVTKGAALPDLITSTSLSTPIAAFNGGLILGGSRTITNAKDEDWNGCVGPERQDGGPPPPGIFVHVEGLPVTIPSSIGIRCVIWSILIIGAVQGAQPGRVELFLRHRPHRFGISLGVVRRPVDRRRPVLLGYGILGRWAQEAQQ